MKNRIKFTSDKETTRIKIWFTNGLFRAFPEVNGEAFDFNDEQHLLVFEFSGGHGAVINLENVNFIEIM